VLDLSSIRVVDNHCHPVLLKQEMDALRFRGYFTEATHPSFAQTHLPNAVYYLWMLRQLAAFYGCDCSEEAIIATRNSIPTDVLINRLVQAADVDTLILDIAYPLPEMCYEAEHIGLAGQCRIAKMLRLETLMQHLVVEHVEFSEMVDRFTRELSNVRENGYCALKSIVAYRSGLDIETWSKDEAVASFTEARAEALQQSHFRLTHKPLIDYLLHVAFRQAAEQQIPIQFHTGYGDSTTDMRLGNPLHLRNVLECSDYQTTPIILLHESYPYCQLGAYLATIYPNVYFDLSYAIPFVDRLEMVAFTRQALSITPASKLLYSSDGIYVPEMYWASALRGRSVLSQVLQEMIAADEIDQEQAYQLAQQILHDTACAIYQL
jgi:hypothetical protein